MTRILAAALAVVVASFLASGFLVKNDTGRQSQKPALIQAIVISPEDFVLLDHKITTHFPDIRFVGGLVFRSSNPHFGALSGLRIDENGLMTAVSDTDFWFQGRIERSDDGIPVGISDGRMAPLLDDDGKPFSQKWFDDAEGLTFSDGAAYVSTEQDARIVRYVTGGDLLAHRRRSSVRHSQASV